MTKQVGPLRPVIRLMTKKRATSLTQLKALVKTLWRDAIMVYAASDFGDDPQPALPDVCKYAEQWAEAWQAQGWARKTEVYYFIIPYGKQADAESVCNAALHFTFAAFDCYDEDAPLSCHDHIIGIHQRGDNYEAHLLVDRHGYDKLLYIRPTGKCSFAALRALIAKTASQFGLAISETAKRQPRGLTMSYSEARAAGIDLRKYQKVKRLPEGVELKAVAAIWGDRQYLRCLFETAAGDRFLRTVLWREDYLIEELGVAGNELDQGVKYRVAANFRDNK